MWTKVVSNISRISSWEKVVQWQRWSNTALVCRPQGDRGGPTWTAQTLHESISLQHHSSGNFLSVNALRWIMNTSLSDNQAWILKLYRKVFIISRLNGFMVIPYTQNYKGQNALAIATERGHTECITHINTKQSKPQVLIPELVGNPQDEDFLYRWV